MSLFMCSEGLEILTLGEGFENVRQNRFLGLEMRMKPVLVRLLSSPFAIISSTFYNKDKGLTMPCLVYKKFKKKKPLYVFKITHDKKNVSTMLLLNLYIDNEKMK